MKPFTEALRYEYNLTPDSWVMDIGGYRGDWASEINRKYGCSVIVFEPAIRFYERIMERFKDNPKIGVMNAAVGGSSRVDKIAIRGDSTGFFSDGELETVVVMPIKFALAYAPHWGLVKINAEGSEFEIMESVLQHDLARLVDNWQIQFHPIVFNHENRYAAIRAGLSKTHELTYDEPWCWCNYELTDPTNADLRHSAAIAASQPKETTNEN